MRYRVRHLSTVGPGTIDLRGDPNMLDGRAQWMSAEAGRVFDIQSEELELSEDEVIASLRSGRLKSTDLVHENDTWVPLADSVVFAGTAKGRAIIESLRRNWTYLLVAIAVAAAVAYLGWKLAEHL
jgi:hypothetical protein